MHHEQEQPEDWGHDDDCQICKEARDNTKFLDAFGALQDRAYATAKEKGWHDQPRELGTLIALMHSELSEALEALRHDAMSDKIEGFRGVEEELADVIIRIMDAAGCNGWHIAQAVIAKMTYNLTRPHRHGGKSF